MVQHKAHRLIEHIQGFARRHWMPPKVECLRHIVPAAAMVDEFEWNTQIPKKTQLSASNYSTFWSLVVCENFNPKTDPILSSSMQQASCKSETWQLELGSSAKFLAIKYCQRTKFEKGIKLAQSLIKKWSYICDHRGKAANRVAHRIGILVGIGW